jgi:hypothetical protein
MIKNATKLSKKRRRALWAKALESGKYAQTTHTLRDDTGFCCLGVACDIFRQATKQGKWRYNKFFIDGESKKSILPDTVANWFGLDQNDPYLGEDSSNATRLNDQLNKDFLQIAKMVRAL